MLLFTHSLFKHLVSLDQQGLFMAAATRILIIWPYGPVLQFQD